MLTRLGILIVASIAVYTTKQITTNYFKSKSPTSKPSGTAEESFRSCKDGKRKEDALRDCVKTSGTEKGGKEGEGSDNINIDDLPGVMKFQLTKTWYERMDDSSITKDNSKPEINTKSGDNEVKRLQKLANDMGRTQEKQEMELFMYYGLQQQEMEIAELKNDLEMKTVESNKLTVAIKMLQVENNMLQEEIRQCLLAKSELEKAKTKIRELQKKIQTNTNPINGHQIMMLGQQVAGFRTDSSLENGAGIQAKFKAGRELELEVMELKRKWKELQLEKRVLSIKLVAAEARISTVSDTTESDVIKRLKVEKNAARLVNENLLTQVEELQQNRFDVVEEVVYQRWINACLRHEIPNYQTPRKSSSTDVESVYSPQSSTEGESKDHYNFSDDNSSGKTQIHQKTSLTNKFKRWRNRFDRSRVGSSLRKHFGSSSKSTASSESGMSRRSSFSSGSFGASKLKKLRDRVAVPTVEKTTTNSPEFRRRRVSFNDSLNSVIPAEEKSTTDTESVKRRRRRVSLSDLQRSTIVVDEKYPNYRGERKIVFELQNPSKESDEVRTEVFTEDSITLGTMSEAGESITLSLVNSSTEENTDDSMITGKTESKNKPANHIEEMNPVMPKKPDINITDALSTFFLFLVFLYLFLRCVLLWCYSKPSIV